MISLREELFEFLAAQGADAHGELHDEVSLIRSGALDSTALFDLALWIEERVPTALELGAFDLAEEWDTPAKVLAFLERYGAAGRP